MWLNTASYMRFAGLEGAGGSDMSFKILRIIARLNIGGPARNAVLLSEGLRETVLVCGEVGQGEGDMMYLAREKGIEPVIVKELGRELSIRNDWRAFWKIYKIICRERPDIIHTHTAKAGTLGRLAGMLYNVTVVLDFPPRRVARTIKKGSSGVRSNSKKRTVLVHTFHGHVFHSYFGKVKAWFFICVEKILALFTDRIITVSESLKKELVEKFRIASERKFSVIELGFELDELLKLPLRKNSDCVNIGIIGRLVPVKNHEILFRAVKNLRTPPYHSLRSGTGQANSLSRAKSRDELRTKTFVIGDGELRQELENYVRGLGIEDMVEFKGWIRDLREIYDGLDIVALTSLNEGTPVSIIEAMAAGRPVVATEVGGVSDIVQDGKTGYLVRDEKAFTERLLDLIRDGEKRERFGLYGRELLTQRFLKDRLVRDTDNLYRVLLQK